MFGNAINREGKETDPNSGNRSSREVRAQDSCERMEGTKDSGAEAIARGFVAKVV